MKPEWYGDAKRLWGWAKAYRRDGYRENGIYDCMWRELESWGGVDMATAQMWAPRLVTFSAIGWCPFWLAMLGAKAAVQDCRFPVVCERPGGWSFLKRMRLGLRLDDPAWFDEVAMRWIEARERMQHRSREEAAKTMTAEWLKRNGLPSMGEIAVRQRLLYGKVVDAAYDGVSLGEFLSYLRRRLK